MSRPKVVCPCHPPSRLPLLPAASSCIGRLGHHSAPVTALCMLPGGWLLAAADSDGALSCTDLRMISSSGSSGTGGAAASGAAGGASSGGARVLWSVKAARGSVCTLAALLPGPGSRGAGAGPVWGGGRSLVVSGGGDGAIRVWKAADGRLVQAVEGSPGGGRPGSRGSSAPAVTGVAVCEEGLVSCSFDGSVRLFPFAPGAM